MKYLKTFEAWGGNPLPIASVSSMMSYNRCGDCNALYKTFNNTQSKCAYCKSDKIRSIDIDEYYDEMCKRLDADEIEDALKDKEAEEKQMIDLFDYSIGVDRQKHRMNIN